MWVFQFFNDRDVVQFDVEKLVDALERSAYRDIVLQFDRDFVVHERLEEAGTMVSSLFWHLSFRHRFAPCDF